MGLYISYCSKAISKNSDEDGYHINNPKCFSYQLGSLNRHNIYDISSDSESGHFSAGSYGGYGIWRNHLIEMCGYNSLIDVCNDIDFSKSVRYYKLNEIKTGVKFNSEPFYEIISFTDCDGSVGSEISKKLYNDFVNFDDKAKEQYDYFYELYSNFKEAFRVASDNGLVNFH